MTALRDPGAIFVAALMLFALTGASVWMPPLVAFAEWLR